MKAQKVFEFLGSRNLNTNPIDITGLEGDTYDYELIVYFQNEGVNSSISATFNNDTTANYRFYLMRGDGATASALALDSQTSVALGGNSFTYPSLLIARVTGRSGSERLIDVILSNSQISNDTKIEKRSLYWKDTLDEITSIQLSKSLSVTSSCHIILYRVPKAASQQNWEQIGDPLVWSSETAEKSFTGLDGNQDEQWKISYSLDQELSVEIQNDATASYIRQRIQNSGGTLSAQNTTENAIVTDGTAGDIIINAVTGSNRLCISSASNTSAAQQSERAIWYTDTSTNINSLSLTPSSSASGQAILYRKIKHDLSGSLPWELAAEPVEISGDFSAGHVFDNLEGDKSTLFRIEFVGHATSGNSELRYQLNADTANNKIVQYLQGDTSTPSAQSGTFTYTQMGQFESTDMLSSEVIIYPRTGSSRPSLQSRGERERTVRFQADWYSESITEISSLKIFNSTSNATTGTLKLWRLK